MSPQTFTAQLATFYAQHGRDLPWRQARADGSFDPYHIFVSEMMLQQTQVPRVIPKYLQFIEQFPSLAVLAQAPLAEVLRAWSGLGYNRRAKYLWQAASQIIKQGSFPADMTGLCQLPGIGKNTAGAILAYGFNQPVIFIETNIRSVFIHDFFVGQQKVSDAAIVGRLEECLAQTAQSPRDFYWALMDYGSYLKRTAKNPSRRSAGYLKQSAFQGSRRQIRGRVLRALTDKPQSLSQLRKEISDERLETVLGDLLGEALIEKRHQKYGLYN